MKPALLSIVTRSYLADPGATERELIAMGYADIVSQLKNDYELGRMAENYATLTGKRIVSEAIESPPTTSAVLRAFSFSEPDSTAAPAEETG